VAQAEGRIAGCLRRRRHLDRGAPGRDRVRRKRDAHLGHGVLRGAVPGGRPRHHRVGRVVLELSRIPADEGARRDQNDVVGNDASGQLNLEALERAIGPRTSPAVYATTTTTSAQPLSYSSWRRHQ
jgi:hypothetical protein